MATTTKSGTKSGTTKSSNREKSLIESSDFIRDQHLWIKILIGMVLGITIGLIFAPEGLDILRPYISEEHDPTAIIAEWVALPGTLFLGMIKMVIIPLVACSIILGIAENANIEFLKRMGLRIVPYFIITTAIAITIGIALVQTIQPGLMVEQSIAEQAAIAGSAMQQQTFGDLTIPQRIANIIPANPARASLERNMLQIVAISIFIGVALITIPSKTGKPFRDLCIAGQTLSMKIISWAMSIAPYAVFGLLCKITIEVGIEALLSVGLYTLTVLAGLACMFITYLLIIKTLAHEKIGKFLNGIKEAQLLAFSTSSSAATMPFSIHAAEHKLGHRPEISRFIIPLGATVNMDGTALYQAVAALFLCQVYGIDLSNSEIIILLITTVGASIGTPATPGVGIIVLATILGTIGVPAEGLALIIGVDRILDMCRTTVNVTGDLTASAVMNRWLPKRK